MEFTSPHYILRGIVCQILQNSYRYYRYGQRRRILHVRRSDFIPTIELRRRLRPSGIPAEFVQRFRWFRQSEKRKAVELIGDLCYPSSNAADEVVNDTQGWPRIFGSGQLKNNWTKIVSECAQGCRARGSSIPDVVNSIGDAGSTRAGWMLPQVQSKTNGLSSEAIHLSANSISRHAHIWPQLCSNQRACKLLGFEYKLHINSYASWQLKAKDKLEFNFINSVNK